MKRISLLMILLTIFLVGCQNKTTTSVIEVNEKPTAIVTVTEGPLLVGAEVTLDASKSQDPEGGTLRYKWNLLAIPRYSELTTSFLTDQKQLSFTPDYPGYYILSLFVNDGSLDSDPLLLTLHVTGEGEEVSEIDVESTKTSTGTVGQPIRLDATKSYNANDQLDLTFTWTLVSQPAASQLTLPENQTGVLELVPDKLGTYLLSLVVNDGQNMSETLAYSIFVIDEAKHVTEEAGTDTATITWTTNVPSTSVIKYGTDSSDMNIEVVDSNLVTDHIITLDNLEPETTYYYELFSYTAEGDEIRRDYNYSTYDSFKTKSAQVIKVINLGEEIYDVIFDRANNQAYALDQHNKEIMIIDIAQGQITERVPLKYQPTHFCLAEDRNALFIVNYGSSYVTEVDLITRTITREIEWVAPFSSTDSMIYYQAPDRLYIKDSYSSDAYENGLWMINLTTLAYQNGSSNISDLKKFIFSQDGTTLYTWSNTDTSNYSLDKYDTSTGDVTTWTSNTQATLTGTIDGNLFAVPLYLSETEGTLFVGDMAINTSDLSLIKDFGDGILYVDETNGVVITRNYIYSSTAPYDQIGTLTSSFAVGAFISTDGTLFMLKREYDFSVYKHVTKLYTVPLDQALF